MAKRSKTIDRKSATEAPVALVTGGSRGIGRGICVELAGGGFAVAINYATNEDAARQTQQLLGSKADSLLCQGDVAVAADRERMVDQVLARWGRIDLLVNNAGITSVGRRDILEATEESWDQVLDVNLKGPFFLMQRVAREMIRLRPKLGNPTIISITSLSSYAASTNRGDYCISKAGLSMATRLYALRLAEVGIRVYEVRPGIIETDLTRSVRDRYSRLIEEGMLPIRRWGTPADVGQAVASLATGAFSYSTGDVINVDGGLHVRKFP
jgi:NAD(P)-dependent dehydrogenase (short-subunit alcohol dehydrogenase family)